MTKKNLFMENLNISRDSTEYNSVNPVNRILQRLDNESHSLLKLIRTLKNPPKHQKIRLFFLLAARHIQNIQYVIQLPEPNFLFPRHQRRMFLHSLKKSSERAIWNRVAYDLRADGKDRERIRKVVRREEILKKDWDQKLKTPPFSTDSRRGQKERRKIKDRRRESTRKENQNGPNKRDDT